MSTVRLRRLQSDYEQLRRFLQRQPRIRLIQADGNPPERYQFEYQIKGLRQVDDQLRVVVSHMVEVALPLSYPRLPPQCRMLTPIFHPNIAPHAICIGDHWSAGEPLWGMIARIGEIIAYQSYNTKSPLNGEAAQWVDQNVARLPLDPVNLFVDEPPAKPRAVAPAVPVAQIVKAAPPVLPGGNKAGSSVPVAIPAPRDPSAVAIVVACPKCQKRYRVSAASAGKWLRCKNCQNLIAVPAES